jgi:hypothetical protein
MAQVGRPREFEKHLAILSILGALEAHERKDPETGQLICDPQVALKYAVETVSAYLADNPPENPPSTAVEQEIRAEMGKPIRYAKGAPLPSGTGKPARASIDNTLQVMKQLGMPALGAGSLDAMVYDLLAGKEQTPDGPLRPKIPDWLEVLVVMES